MQFSCVSVYDTPYGMAQGLLIPGDVMFGWRDVYSAPQGSSFWTAAEFGEGVGETVGETYHCVRPGNEFSSGAKAQLTLKSSGRA